MLQHSKGRLPVLWPAPLNGSPVSFAQRAAHTSDGSSAHWTHLLCSWFSICLLTDSC